MSHGPSHPFLAREGWLHIALAVVIAVGVTGWVGWAWSIPFWLVTLFVVQFFRDPVRESPDVAGQVLSPADGKIVFIGPARDPYLERNALKISVFMNVFSVHSNRCPVKGTVKKIWYNQGRFFNAELDKASDLNERNAIWISEAQTGVDVVFVQIAGLIARRILCYVSEGETLYPGQRYGFIRFGSRVDVYLPESFVTEVQLGDKVTAGVDVLAKAA